MTQEEKLLLTKDLCERLPYGVIINSNSVSGELLSIDKRINGDIVVTNKILSNSVSANLIENIKPYLRPMSSMTEEEVAEYKAFHCVAYEHTYFYPQFCTVKNELNMFDWLNSHHFDYRGLIPMGLALEAPEGMYLTK